MVYEYILYVYKCGIGRHSTIKVTLHSPGPFTIPYGFNQPAFTYDSKPSKFSIIKLSAPIVLRMRVLMCYVVALRALNYTRDDVRMVYILLSFLFILDLSV